MALLMAVLLQTMLIPHADAHDRDKRDYRIVSMGTDWNVCMPESHPECQRFNAQERRYRMESREREHDREEARLRELDRRLRSNAYE